MGVGFAQIKPPQTTPFRWIPTRRRRPSVEKLLWTKQSSKFQVAWPAVSKKLSSFKLFSGEHFNRSHANSIGFFGRLMSMRIHENPWKDLYTLDKLSVPNIVDKSEKAVGFM